MEFRIVEKPAFNLVGVSRRVPCSLKSEPGDREARREHHR